MVTRKNTVTFILIVLLLSLAAALRFFHAYSLPFNYDELSAISRTHYRSFTELIDKGVRTVYTNPAGIQVLLYYWTKIAGYTEFMVKLPFLIFGIASVLYIFLIGKEWFNDSSGLICAAYTATLQYFIIWSQLARPMIPGLFFTLAMAYHWTQIVFKPGKKYDLHWALYVLFASCCAYTHHFCLLLVIISAITGIIFVNRDYRIRYVAAGIMIFVLYIPHLHIFFDQLSKKGIGNWLGPPRNDYIITYLEYVLQFSPYVECCTGALVLFGIIYRIWERNPPNRYFYISLAWFIITFLTGFYYSRLVSPLLKSSVLLFSFPFLMLALFGLLPEMKGLFNTLAVLMVCAVNVYSLTFERRHYDIFYRAPIEQNALLTDSVHRALGSRRSITMMELDRDGTRNEKFYIKKYGLDTSFVTIDSAMDMVTLTDFLKENRKEFLSYTVMAESGFNRIPVLLSYYPYIVKQYNFYGGTFYLLSSDSGKYPSPYSFHSDNNFETTGIKYWDNGNQPPIVDSVSFSAAHSLKMDSTREYGPGFTCKLSDMISNKNDIITASVMFYPVSPADNIFIVSTIESDGKQVDWRASDIGDYVMLGVREKWIKAFHTIKLSDINFNLSDAVVKIYIWNKGKRNFFIDDFDVRTIKGNPILYGLDEKL